MLLFKPFHHIEDVKSPHQTWFETYQNWDRTLLDFHTFSKLESYEQNIQDMVDGLQQKKKEQEERADMRREQKIPESSKYQTVDGSENIFDLDDNDPDTFSNYTPQLPTPNCTTPLGIYAMTVLSTLSNLGGLTLPPTIEPTPESQQLPHSIFIGPGHPDHDLLSSDVHQRKLQDNLTHQVETLRSNPNLDLNQSSNNGSGTPLSKTMIQHTSLTFGLNEKQNKVLTKVGETLLDSLDSTTDTTQLLSYIGGPGGTGKSRIIQSIQHMFKSCGKLSTLKTMSYTGTASSNVNGSTMSSTLKDQKYNSTSLKLNPNQLGGLQ